MAATLSPAAAHNAIVVLGAVAFLAALAVVPVIAPALPLATMSPAAAVLPAEAILAAVIASPELVAVALAQCAITRAMPGARGHAFPLVLVWAGLGLTKVAPTALVAHAPTVVALAAKVAVLVAAGARANRQRAVGARVLVPLQDVLRKLTRVHVIARALCGARVALAVPRAGVWADRLGATGALPR